MFPNLYSAITLWGVQRMVISGWFICRVYDATVTYVECLSDKRVHLRVQTTDGLELECIRPISVTLDDLFQYPWQRARTVVSPLVKESPEVLILESVLVHNCYQEGIGRKDDSTPHDGLIVPGSNRPWIFPTGDVIACRRHNRYSYQDKSCPMCAVSAEHEEESTYTSVAA